MSDLSSVGERERSVRLRLALLWFGFVVAGIVAMEEAALHPLWRGGLALPAVIGSTQLLVGVRASDGVAACTVFQAALLLGVVATLSAIGAAYL